MGEVERLHERAKKPPPERTGPVRAWSAAETGSASAARPEAPAAGEPAPPDAPEPPPEGAPGAVDAGYKVIEEYLNQGRETAEQMGFGLAGGLAAAGSFQALTARLFRDGLLWLEHLSKFAATPGEGESAEAPATASNTAEGRIRMRVASRRPAEVDLRLGAPGGEEGLGIHALHCPEPGAPPLDDVALERSGGDWVVSVRVTDRHPAGVYSGVVYDRRDGSVRGTLTVHVTSEASP
jgi:hypothetical protein